jgi:hypothetical protein
MVAKEQAQRDKRQSFEQQVLATASQMDLPLDAPAPTQEPEPQEIPANQPPPPAQPQPQPLQAPTVGSLFVEGTMGVRSIPADVLLRHKRG